MFEGTPNLELYPSPDMTAGDPSNAPTPTQILTDNSGDFLTDESGRNLTSK